MAATFISGAGALIFITNAAERQMRDETREAALRIARQVSYVFGSLLLLQQHASVSNLMTALSADSNTIAVALVKPNADTIASAGTWTGTIPVACSPNPKVVIGVDDLIATSLVTDQHGDAACFVVKRSLTTMKEQLHEIRRSVMLVLPIFTALTAFGLSILLGRLVCRPLQRLRQSTATLSGGQFPPAISTQSRDEIGSLTRDFNFMVSKLRNAEQIQRQLTSGLEESNAQAKIAVQAKTDFLANMSHELRTPMNSMLGFTELLIGTGLTSEQSEYAEEALKGGQSLLRLIESILDFSSLEAGRAALRTLTFAPGKVAHDCLSLISPKAERKGLLLTYHLGADLPSTVDGDPDRLGQVLLILLENAVKFTERGRIHLQIDSEGHTPQGVGLRYSIEDTGIGISRPALESLFLPFTQAEGSLSRRFGGIGLSLAIAKALVENMGGWIHCESNPGEGSTFSFTLRLKSSQYFRAGAVAAEA